jgi:hypothetical protein
MILFYINQSNGGRDLYNVVCFCLPLFEKQYHNLNSSHLYNIYFISLINYKFHYGIIY